MSFHYYAMVAILITAIAHSTSKLTKSSQQRMEVKPPAASMGGAPNMGAGAGTGTGAGTTLGKKVKGKINAGAESGNSK